MNFKEWIYNELSGSNAYARMVRQHSGYKNMPKYVRDEFINTSFGHSVNSSSVKDKINQKQIQPSEFLQKSPYKDKQWLKKPELINVTPLNFDEKTLNIFINRCFGYRPMPTIRNDHQRMNQQQKSLKINDNEPVIILQEGDKFKLQEGWHRTMSILVWESNPQYGAPNNDIKTLKEFANQLIQIDQSFVDQFGVESLMTNSKTRINWLNQTTRIAEDLKKVLNLEKWQPVNLKAFVGRTKTFNKNTDYDISTGDY